MVRKYRTRAQKLAEAEAEARELEEAAEAAGPANESSLAIDFQELGRRIKAYRVGASMSVDDAAASIGISRAALYRMEQGHVIKIERLDRLAKLLDTSLASLLGVDIEYYSTALGFLERLSQVEPACNRIIAHFSPISQLLSSNEYLEHLSAMLLETTPLGLSPKEKSEESAAHAAEVDAVVNVLKQRRAVFEKKKPSIVSLIGLREIEHFLQIGMIGNPGLDETLHRQRLAAARQEVTRIAELMENGPMHIQVALVADGMPATPFQLMFSPKRTVLAVSLFRLGELPSIRNGVASITTSEEAIRLYQRMADQLWKIAYKGKEGADKLRALLKRTA